MWLRDFPIAELVKRDVLPAEPPDMTSRVEKMLAFFGVASVDAWEDVYAELACAFRTSKAYETETKALAAWLRLGRDRGPVRSQAAGGCPAFAPRTYPPGR